MKKSLYWIIGLCIAAILGITIYKKISHTREGIHVAAEAVQERTIIESVSASGKINPEKEVKISPDVSGELISLNVEEGDTVYKGQLLATINATTYQSSVRRAEAQLNQTQSVVQNAKAQLQQAKAQLEQALTTYKRNQQLFAEKVISAAEFETAEANYKTAQASYKAAIATIKGNQYGVASAQANVNEAAELLQRTTIYAPMSGVVSALFVKKGERVVGTMQMAGTEMMRISDLSKLKVEVEVGENDIVKIHVGDSAKVEVEAYGNRLFYGRVSNITQAKSGGLAAAAGSINEQVTNYTVSVLIDPSSYALMQRENPGSTIFRPGMSASVEIFTKRKNGVLSVPINAVTTRDDENATGSYLEIIKEYVFVDSSGHAVLRQITTGLQDTKYIEVRSGLKKNEKVLVAPYSAIARTLKHQDKIKIVPKEDLYDAEEKENE